MPIASGMTINAITEYNRTMNGTVSEDAPNPFLVFIALFVWIGAAQEAAMAETKSVLGSVTAKDAMIPEFHTLSPRDDLSQAVKLVLNGWQQDFPVVEEGRVIGMLLRADMIATLASGEVHASVQQAMREDFPVASPVESFQSVFTRLHDTQVGTVPIVENGRLVGLITLENMTEYMMLHAALSEAKKVGDGRVKSDLLTLTGRTAT